MTENRVVALRQKGAIDDPLTEILRAGARRLIAQAVEAEFETFLVSTVDLVLPDGRQRVVRHGHDPVREIQTGIGPVEVQKPKARDRGVTAGARIRFRPNPVWIRACGIMSVRGQRWRPVRQFEIGMPWRGTPRTPPRPPAGPAASRRTAEFRSEDRQSHLADGEGQLYSRSWRNAPSGGSGRHRANPVTPLKSHRHHPLSRIARR